MLWTTIVAVLTLVSSIVASPTKHSHGHHHLHRRAAGSNTYTVSSGDTGTVIAAAYSITFNTLNNSNPNVNWNNLQIGQNLVMPSSRIPISYVTVSGDTGSSICNKFDIYSQDLTNANPNVNLNSIPSGTKLRVPGYGSWTTYTVTSGDYGDAIANAEGISFNTLSSANPGVNWNNLQIGQVLKVPAGVSPTTGTIPSPAPSPASTTTTTVLTSTSTSKSSVVSSSTTTSSTTSTTTTAKPLRSTIPAATTSTSSSTIKTSSTTSSIATTQTASVTGSNAVASVNNSDGVSSRADNYTFYQGDGSASAGWPAINQWISFSTMWSNLSPYIGQSCYSSWGVANNSASETQDIYNAIQDIAAKSKVDHRLILAVIVQESSGCVRVPTTSSSDGIVNPGLMQDYNGTGTCNKGGSILNPCPTSNINQMIGDGVYGTTTSSSSLFGGYVQDINGQNSAGYSGSQAIYRAARIYNSGSISSSDLGAPGATRCYCSDIANRLMGWVGAKKTCTLS